MFKLFFSFVVNFLFFYNVSLASPKMNFEIAEKIKESKNQQVITSEVPKFIFQLMEDNGYILSGEFSGEWGAKDALLCFGCIKSVDYTGFAYYYISSNNIACKLKLKWKELEDSEAINSTEPEASDLPIDSSENSILQCYPRNNISK